MTAHVYCYELRVDDVQIVNLPSAHQILSVAPGRGRFDTIDCWTLVAPSHHTVARTFHVVGTGNPMPYTDDVFVGTAVMPNGLVWHVFVEPR